MIYVMGDIHGNMRRFKSVLKQIKLRPTDTLYILGDVVDRYPDGVKILRWIMERPNVKMILGNHEYMMLRALGKPYDEDDLLDVDDMKLWYRNGGFVTHKFWKHQQIETREQIVSYLKNLPLNYDVEVNGISYKLVHGAPATVFEAYKFRYDTPAQFAVWKRLHGYEDFGNQYTVIFGHTPTLEYQDDEPMKIWYGDKLIGIDCGSGFSDEPGTYYARVGRLACLRLDDMKEFYSEEPMMEDENEK